VRHFSLDIPDRSSKIFPNRATFFILYLLKTKNPNKPVAPLSLLLESGALFVIAKGILPDIPF